MSTTRVLAGVLGAAALISPAAAAQAAVPDKLADTYNREYRQAKKAGGEPGRHIVRDDVRTKNGVREARAREVERSIGVLERMQAPAPAPAAATTGGSTAGSGLDAIAACESGGDPGAVSADGTYRGKYQFDQQTWESVGGTGDPAAAPEAVQDEMAARLQAQRGSNPWPVCG
ncbi:MAG: transglycosylase family protein [Solirubrobacteraceae bacterium]